MRDNKVNILWLSDIHFYAEYKLIYRPNYLEYFRLFFSKIENEHNIRPYDYIIISGDLAQQGTQEDYDAFWDEFLKKLLDVFLKYSHKPKLLTIPGNHDVKWANSDFFKEFIKKIEPNVDYPDKNEFLSLKPDRFKELFKDYSEFVTKNIQNKEDGKYKQFINYESNFYEISEDYKNHALFGYVVDHQKNAIFILLNSAWFSLGSQFDKLYANYLKENTVKDKSLNKDEIYQILKNRDSFSEFGTQILGLGLFKFNELMDILSKYPDYFVTTCLHHGINWLDWNEYYYYNKTDADTADSNNAFKFNEILKKSDIVITGHEHVPSNYENQLFFSDTLYLRGGCFLFDNQHSCEDKQSNFNASWFSSIYINADTGTLKQYRFKYEKLNQSQDVNWIKELEPSVPLLKKNSKYVLLPERRDSIIEKLKSINETFIRQLFSRFKKIEVNDINKHDSNLEGVKMFIVEYEAKSQLCIAGIENEFYKLINNPTFYSEIDSIFKTIKTINTVQFISIDLFVDIYSYEDYMSTEPPIKSRIDIFNSIAKRADAYFDNFRHDFFSRFEHSELTNVTNLASLSDYYDLNLVNNVIPYWHYEKILL